MSTIAEPIPSPGAFDKRWAWGVRIAALICILPPWEQYAQGRMHPCFGFATFWFWISLAWTAIYFSIVFKAVSRGRLSRAGLSWAANTGLSWSVISIFIIVLLAPMGQLEEGLPWAVLALGSALLAVSAVKTYRSLEPEARVKTILFGKLGVSLICVILECVSLWLLSVAWGPLSLLITPDHTVPGAIASLRTINTVEEEYSSKYNQGFSASLRALGPPSGSAQPDASAAGLIDSSLASGTRRDYIYNYTPGPRDSTGHMATFTAASVTDSSYTITYSPGPRDSTRHITSYTASARSNNGCVNFFTDESGVIRETYENRPANAKDPPLGG
ncbi:MAG: hypothetical protein ACYDA9_16710 [Terriglobia bacterium]